MVNQLQNAYARKGLFFCCYRNGFPNIDGYTNDVGWGCTIRNYQTLIANAILINNKEKNALSFVHDDYRSPFSIQNIVLAGKKYGINVGDWFSPSIAAKCIRDIAITTNTLDFKFLIYGDDYKKGDALDAPAIIILPVKLGVDTMELFYLTIIMEILNDENNVGIIGGQGDSSFYIVGVDKMKFTYLDPHELRAHEDDYNHVKKLYSMKISSLNPSISIPFYVENAMEANRIIEKYHKLFSTADIDDTKVYKCSIDDDNFCIIEEDI